MLNPQLIHMICRKWWSNGPPTWTPLLLLYHSQLAMWTSCGKSYSPSIFQFHSSTLSSYHIVGGPHTWVQP